VATLRDALAAVRSVAPVAARPPTEPVPLG
jgi:hypothetical protein